MKNKNKDLQPTKENIKIQQNLFSSYATILGHCLKYNSPESTECDEKYRQFERQQNILEDIERKYLEPLSDDLDKKTSQFNKPFDDVFDINKHPTEPIVKLSEEQLNLKRDVRKGIAEILQSKREFASFRNNELNKTIVKDPNYSSKSFTLNWQKRFPNKEINALLECDLNLSNEELESIDRTISSNKTAPFISTPEMLNAQLLAVTKSSPRR